LTLEERIAAVRERTSCTIRASGNYGETVQIAVFLEEPRRFATETGQVLTSHDPAKADDEIMSAIEALIAKCEAKRGA